MILDPQEFKNFRHISNINFKNKILEKVVHNQLADFIIYLFILTGNIIDMFQYLELNLAQTQLRDYVGIMGVALKRFSSYLLDRTCLVKIGNCFCISNYLLGGKVKWSNSVLFIHAAPG